MRVKKYEIIDHTADIGIRAYGDSPEEVFSNAASGMFDIIADTSRIKPKKEIKITKQAGGYDELLAAWLDELLYDYSTTGIVFTDFVIRSLTPTEIKAIALGDRAPAENIKTEIKAVTYHQLKFQRTGEGYEAEVIFDV